MNSRKKNPFIISLDISDQLTNVSCGHIVVELIKFIVYQRLQIPYTYQWLKQIISKRKATYDINKKESFQSERHFHTASMSLDNLDFIFKSLLQEISNASSIPSEVCIALGATPVTCKEFYRFILPVTFHKQQCHSSKIATDQKIQQNVFKKLVTSDLMSQVLCNNLAPINTYVYLKKKVSTQDSIVNIDNFIPSSGCQISRNADVIVINFNGINLNNLTCCNQFQIFDDVIKENFENLTLNDQDLNSNEFYEIESNDKFKWYQSTYVMKGFKDCIVQGKSITNMWLEP